MYEGSYVPIDSFKGGYCGNLSPTSLALSQALDLDNIVLDVNGQGWRTRQGNAKVNSSAAFASGAAFQGLGYYLKADGTENLVGIAGGKIGYSTATAGTFATAFTDTTSTVSSGADKQWDFFTFNDVFYGYGSGPTTQEAPFKWTGSGTASSVGGSPPSAYGALTTNNRAFAFCTSTDPSSVAWSILGSAEDWTGVGSGSATIGSLADNQTVTGMKVLSTNYALVFKNFSTYQMILSSAPFPAYTFSSTLGCPGKNASIVVDGICYWITQYRRMVWSDGNTITSSPTSADDLWNAVSNSRAPFISVIREKGADYDWLVWLVSTNGSTNNEAIVWDLLNKCWLRHTTGYKQALTVADKRTRTFYAAYDGFVYKRDPSDTTRYSDDSEVSPGTITGYWRSGWLNFDAIEKITQPNELGVLYKCKASGNIGFAYGFNFVADSVTGSLAQTATGSETRAFRYTKTLGRGNFFNFKISQSSSTIDTQVDKIYIRGKEYGQKVMTNP